MRSFKAPPSKEDERYTNYSSPSLELTLRHCWSGLEWCAPHKKCSQTRERGDTECWLYFQTAWSRISIARTHLHINELAAIPTEKHRWINGHLCEPEKAINYQQSEVFTNNHHHNLLVTESKKLPVQLGLSDVQTSRKYSLVCMREITNKCFFFVFTQSNIWSPGGL